MLKHNSVSVSVGSLGPGAHKVCLSPLRVSGEYGLILNMNSSLLPSCWGISFAIGHAVSPQSHSSAYCLTAVSLTLDVGYLFLASRCSRAVQPPAAAGIGEFNLGDRYIYYCWQESIRRKGVAIIVNERVQNAVLGCSPKTTE